MTEPAKVNVNLMSLKELSTKTMQPRSNYNTFYVAFKRNSDAYTVIFYSKLVLDVHLLKRAA